MRRWRHIRQHIPEHDVLLAGFPCQRFSLAGVSKKNWLGGRTVSPAIPRARCFFDVVRIIDALVRRCLCSKTSKT
ncbi:DNA cytosine methyltransferase [Shigella flexneri]